MHFIFIIKLFPKQKLYTCVISYNYLFKKKMLYKPIFYVYYSTFIFLYPVFSIWFKICIEGSSVILLPLLCVFNFKKSEEEVREGKSKFLNLCFLAICLLTFFILYCTLFNFKGKMLSFFPHWKRQIKEGTLFNIYSFHTF